MPGERVFLTAEWRALVMLNYEVNPDPLLEYVPPGTELDCWRGKAFVSLVGFQFLRTRVFGIRFPSHSNFDEVNLRFYVRRWEGNENRRGVVFIREIVPRRAIAVIARAFYNEQYVACPMRHAVELNSSRSHAAYNWKSGTGWNKITLAATGKRLLPEEGSLEKFITEHYWGYSRARGSGCVEYRVEHPQWRIWSATNAAFEGDAAEPYGKDWVEVFTQKPSSAFLAGGSGVSVYRGTIHR
ncbi:MAG: YqjF family protein [Terriglobales bacterium]